MFCAFEVVVRMPDGRPNKKATFLIDTVPTIEEARRQAEDQFGPERVVSVCRYGESHHQHQEIEK
jgi:hypothetical protein